MKDLRKILSTISGDKSLTRFEKDVLKVVARIPKGKTRTYGWVAAAVGRPRGSRAVGNALNKNPYAPIVPCHRVIRSDGSLGGYAKGGAAKIKLLNSEGIVI